MLFRSPVHNDSHENMFDNALEYESISLKMFNFEYRKINWNEVKKKDETDCNIFSNESFQHLFEYLKYTYYLIKLWHGKQVVFVKLTRSNAKYIREEGKKVHPAP